MEVYDANEPPMYAAAEKMISLSHKHFISDAVGNRLAEISQNPFALMPKFFIEMANGKTHEMKSKLQ